MLGVQEADLVLVVECVGGCFVVARGLQCLVTVTASCVLNVWKLLVRGS